MEVTEKYDYQKAVEDDVREYILCNIASLSKKYADKEEAIEDLSGDLFTNDCVTGNGSGSYTLCNWEASVNLAGNWDLVCDAYEEFGFESIPFADMRLPERMDVTVRCYLLNSAVAEVVNEMWDE